LKKIKILNYYKKEVKLLTIFLTTSLIAAALDLYTPVLVSHLIDDIIPKKVVAEFMKYSLILLVAYLLRMVIGVISTSRGQLMGNRIKFTMRDELFKKILNQSSPFFLSRKSGDLIARLTGDLENTSALLYRGLEDFLFSVLSIIGAVILMVKFDPKLAFFTMLPLPVAVLFTIYQNKRLKEGYTSIRKSVSGLTSGIHDTLKTIHFVKDNVLENRKITEFQEDNSKLLESERKNIYNISSLMAGVNFYNQITQLIVIFAGGYYHIKGEITIGVIVSFILLTNRFRIYLMRLMGLIDTFQKGFTGLERFYELMEIPDPEVKTGVLENPVHCIDIKNLEFSYENNKIFENLNISIEKGEKVAFVGESGVGKTTLLNLLKRNIQPHSGKISLNGKDAEELSKEEYLKRIGIVDQNDHIMDKKLEENIKIINPSLKTEELDKALELACLKGVDLAKNAQLLSTGQKQRVALARLFLKNPDIVLLDEPTSALDNQIEQNIMENIHKTFKDKIIIAVAHRLHTLKNFDRIFHLEKDKVTEYKSYEEFMKKGEIINATSTS
jgi:ATP-binding cassette subfamily B protein